jgi:hypothetical protein
MLAFYHVLQRRYIGDPAMSYQVNIHMPKHINSINELNGDNFVAKKSTDGGLKTIDLYYRDSVSENKKKGFLAKLTGFFKKLTDFKLATKSQTLGTALSNIRGENCSKHWRTDPNVIIATLRDAANTHEREISDKGVTVTVKDWTLDHDKVRLAELPYEL